MSNARLPLLLLAVAISAAAAPRVAVAGPYTDDLSKCLVAKTTAEDKTTLVQWIFSVLALHPSVAQIASIPDASREQLDKRTAALFEVLLTDRCLPEAKQAMEYEGSTAIQASFKVLGEIAARGLFSDPAVTAGSAKMASYIDDKKMKAAFGKPTAPPLATKPGGAPATTPANLPTK